MQEGTGQAAVAWRAYLAQTDKNSRREQNLDVVRHVVCVVTVGAVLAAEHILYDISRGCYNSFSAFRLFPDDADCLCVNACP